MTCVGGVDSILTCNSSSPACASSILSIAHSDFQVQTAIPPPAQRVLPFFFNVKV